MPFEIRYAVDECEIPIIAAYTGYETFLDPVALTLLWPTALAARIQDESARVIHVPFKKEPLADAVSQFDVNNLPKGALSHYSRETYRQWGYT